MLPSARVDFHFTTCDSFLNSSYFNSLFLSRFFNTCSTTFTRRSLSLSLSPCLALLSPRLITLSIVHRSRTASQELFHRGECVSLCVCARVCVERVDRSTSVESLFLFLLGPSRIVVYDCSDHPVKFLLATRLSSSSLSSSFLRPLSLGSRRVLFRVVACCARSRATVVAWLKIRRR